MEVAEKKTVAVEMAVEVVGVVEEEGVRTRGAAWASAMGSAMPLGLALQGASE